MIRIRVEVELVGLIYTELFSQPYFKVHFAPLASSSIILFLRSDSSSASLLSRLLALDFLACTSNIVCSDIVCLHIRIELKFESRFMRLNISDGCHASLNTNANPDLDVLP